MTENEMRKATVPTFKSGDDVLKYIDGLVKQEHDYGTCVYAMSMAAIAAYNYVGSQLGVTGFQASCADLDIIARNRGWKHGFQLLNYEDLLYPQYAEKFDAISFDALIEKNKDWLKKEAATKLLEGQGAHGDVVAHWKRLAQ